MKKIILFGFLIIGIFILSGCVPKTTCNEPYIVKGNECCLDQNNNKICDEDEVETKKSTEVEEEAKIIITPNDIRIANSEVQDSMHITSVPYEDGKNYIFNGEVTDSNVGLVVFKVKNSGTKILEDLLVNYKCYDYSIGRYTDICEKPITITTEWDTREVNICSHEFIPPSNLVRKDKDGKYTIISVLASGYPPLDLHFMLNTGLLNELWDVNKPQEYHKINCEIEVGNNEISAKSSFKNYWIRDD